MIAFCRKKPSRYHLVVTRHIKHLGYADSESMLAKWISEISITTEVDVPSLMDIDVMDIESSPKLLKIKNEVEVDALMDIDVIESSPILPINKQRSFKQYASAAVLSPDSTPKLFSPPPNITSSPILNTLTRRRLYSD